MGMNRACRRNHQKAWKVKVVDDIRRLVVCPICGGVDNEYKVRPKETL